jgi:hypothetical protein
MQVFLITAIWGPWHIDAYLRVTLPTLLAENNIPALAREHDCRYRMFTTEVSAKRLEDAPGVARLRELIPVDVIVMAPEDALSSDVHLKAWQQAVDEATLAQAAAVSVHPDAPWSNGSFAFLARALSEGRKALVVPNIRVVSETFVPALEACRAGDVIALSGPDICALALKHLHPLSIAMVPQVGQSASATEIYWGVQGQGLSLRHASRPAIAAVPHACSLDLEFYMREVKDKDAVVNVTDVNQMLMLSLAPLFKDFSLMEPAHQASSLLLGRWCAHPQNDTPLKDWYAGQSLRLPLGPDGDEAVWKEAELAGDTFMSHASVNLASVNLHYALRQPNCRTVAKVLALALHETRLDQRVRCPPLGRQGVVLAPNDAAFALFGKDRLAELLLPGNEEHLLDLMLFHYRPDWTREQAERAMVRAGIGITAWAFTDRLCVLVIERVLEPPGE